jgi:hypothetical protein
MSFQRSFVCRISCIATFMVVAVGGLSDTTLASADSGSSSSTIDSTIVSTIDKNGTVHAAAFEIPFSSLASEEAKEVFIERSMARDFTMSSAIYSHTQLIKAGVDAEIYLWDGLDHAFMYDTRLPESHEAYDITVKFFERHLGKR